MLIRIFQGIIILITIFAINSVLGLVKADIYKREGKESLKKNFPYLAVDKFSKALKLNSSDGEARGYLGISYTNLAERNKDREFLKKAIYEIKDALKTHEDPSINYHLANTYELSGNIDNAIQEAVKSYNQIPSEQTKDKLIALYKTKGDILLSQNKKDEAIKFYSKFVELKEINATNKDTVTYEFLRTLLPDNFFVRYCLLMLYMRQNLWDKAVVEVEYIKHMGISNEDIMGKLIEVYYMLGNKYYNEKKFKEAEQYLNYIINADTTGRFCCLFSTIHILSLIHEQIGNIDKAVETWLKLESFDTQKGQGYYHIGSMFNRKLNPQKAVEFFEKYLPFRPHSDTGIFLMLGNLYEQIGVIDKALEMYKKLENIDSYEWQGHYYIGLLYEKKESWADALVEFENVLKIKPEDSQMLLKIGQLYERVGNNKRAIEIYRNVIVLDPLKESQLSLLISKLYEKMGEREKALFLFKKTKVL